MKIHKFTSHYLITDILEHKQIKNKLINLIYEMKTSNINKNDEKISRTDWNLCKNTKRKYLDFFYEIITPYMEKMCEKLKCKNWRIDNAWYQIYHKNDIHPWHVHEFTNYTNVYFLDLPNDKIKTEIYNMTDNKIKNDIELKEGQLFTFPANIIHRSPLNKYHESKKIISFNSNFWNVDFTKIY